MLTIPQVAALLAERGTAYSERTIRRWCEDGKVFPNAVRPTNPQRGYWLIPESDLEGFVKPKRGRRKKERDDEHKSTS